ncbi:MAG: outer membrane beta-barrel protein [Lewinella sp.]|nr:outer membrane beta-barrel protein [Lewinella sp.]
MQRLLIITLFCFAGLALQAQHETLFGQARVVGGFGGPIWEFGLNNDIGTAAGGGGGIVINSVFIGAYGVGSIDFNQLFDEGDVDVLDLGHGGIWIGGTYRPSSLLHLYASGRIGWGALNVEFDGNQNYRDIDKVFVLTPEIGVELNVTRWFRVAGTIGYRYLQGANEDLGYKDEDFSGTMIGLTARFGWFGRRR